MFIIHAKRNARQPLRRQKADRASRHVRRDDDDRVGGGRSDWEGMEDSDWRCSEGRKAPYPRAAAMATGDITAASPLGRPFKDPSFCTAGAAAAAAELKLVSSIGSHRLIRSLCGGKGEAEDSARHRLSAAAVLCDPPTGPRLVRGAPLLQESSIGNASVRCRSTSGDRASGNDHDRTDREVGEPRGRDDGAAAVYCSSGSSNDELSKSSTPCSLP